MRIYYLFILLLAGTVVLSQEFKDSLVSETNSYQNLETVNGVAKDKISFHGPRTLADMPNVVDNPKRIFPYKTAPVQNRDAILYNSSQLNAGILKPNAACEEENPNDFTFENGYPCSSISPYKVANDLTVAPDEDFTLTGMTVSIFANGGISNVSAFYYSDDFGKPGTQIGSEVSATIISQSVIGSNFGLPVNELKLSVTPFVFAGQNAVPTTYWIELQVTDVGNTANVHWVITSSSKEGNATAQYDYNGWTIPDATVDGVYIWEGNCDPLGTGGGAVYCEENNLNNLFEQGYRSVSTGPARVANDVTVAANENFTLTHITANVFSDTAIGDVSVRYFADSGGLPGSLIGSQALATIQNQTVIGNNFGFDVIALDLAVDPFVFTGQVGAPTTYWIELSFTGMAATNDIFWIATSSTSVGNATATFNGSVWSIANSIYDGAYAWKGNCDLISSDPFFPSPYCGPVDFSGSVEPMTLVSVAGIDNRTDASIGASPGHEDFTAIEGAVVTGNSYPIVLEGNTAGPFENHFVVFIDWNQNGVLNDPGEVYPITQTIIGSTGIDGKQALGNIDVPAGALTGTTRMRVKKLSGLGNHLNPCRGTAYGQAEDYTLQVLNSHTDFVYDNNIWTPVDPQGVCTAVDNIHVKNGSTTFTDNISANNITIDSGASLYVEKVLTPAGALLIDGDLIFVSNATGNGSLGYVANSVAISGNATTQIYMSSNRSYRMVSSSVTTSTSIHDNWQEGASSNTHNPNPGFGTHITGSTIDQVNGFDGTATGNPSLFTVDVENQQFEVVSNTDVNTLSAGEAYLLFVRGSRSIDLSDNDAFGSTVLRTTGALFTGSQVQNFPDAEEDDFIMFGNPYQSAVDLNSVFANSTNLITSHYYVYDPKLADNGAYVTVLLPSGANFSGSAANQYLQPGQGAQVAVSGAGPTMVFNESDKAPEEHTATSRPMAAPAMLTVQLYTQENFQNGGSLHDSCAIVFDANHDNEITQTDAVKPMNFKENLGIDHADTYLSLEYRKMPQPGEEYRLFSTGYTHSAYTLKLTVEGLEDNYLYIDDSFTSTSMLLETGDNTYSFNVDNSVAPSIATDRFSIRVEQRLDVESNSLFSDIQLYPNPLDGSTFYISAPSLNGEQLSVSINDVSGRNIFSETLGVQANTVAVPMGGDVAAGVYIITLKHGGAANTYRMIKE